MKELAHRRAGIADLEFVTTAIIEAERSWTDRTIYERIFGITADELPDMLKSLLSEEIPGSELCCDSFVLAVDGDRPVGCIATWIEADGTLPSSLVRTNLISYAIGAERWKQAQPRLALLHEIDIKREPGSMQIEAVYTAPSHRGRGITSSNIDYAIDSCRGEHPNVAKAQILAVAGNDASAKAFSKSGFVITKQTHSDNPEIRELFPGPGRVLWEKSI
jgi:hypothetical protein